MSESAKKRKGTQYWITNEIKNKKINKEEISNWIILGWRKGRNTNWSTKRKY